MFFTKITPLHKFSQSCLLRVMIVHVICTALKEVLFHLEMISRLHSFFFCRKFVNGALVATMYSALCVYVVFVATSLKQVSYIGFYDNQTF